MKKIFTGIQASGRPHLGNLLGAILPALTLAENPTHQSIFFIADLHAMTTVKNAIQIKENTYDVAAAWLACGLDPEKILFYRQSQLPEVSELLWYLSCVAPFPMLANAHAFKSKAEKLADVNAGLFTYPVLMAADILLWDAHEIPVGKDQIQHIEIARDLAQNFNQHYGEIFVLPEAKLEKHHLIIPGIDGQKMSKSYKNVIDIFLPEAALRKQVMSIQTDSKAVEDIKDPETCNIFQIFKTVASEIEITALKDKYLQGGYGYGQAKNDLLQVLLNRFAETRIAYQTYRENIEVLEEILQKSEEKCRFFTQKKIKEIRKVLGF